MSKYTIRNSAGTIIKGSELNIVSGSNTLFSVSSASINLSGSVVLSGSLNISGSLSVNGVKITGDPTGNTSTTSPASNIYLYYNFS